MREKLIGSIFAGESITPTLPLVILLKKINLESSLLTQYKHKHTKRLLLILINYPNLDSLQCSSLYWQFKVLSCSGLYKPNRALAWVMATIYFTFNAVICLIWASHSRPSLNICGQCLVSIRAAVLSLP